MIIQPIKTRVFQEGDDLLAFITDYFKKLPEKSILVVTSKIVALSENRVVPFRNQREKIRLMKQESDFAVKTKHAWLTLKDGMIMASAGIDESNADGKLILLPRDSFASAQKLRRVFKKRFKLKNIGVIITDSRLLPLRAGVVGVAIGYAGFKGIRNYIGKKDIFGRILKMSRTDIADSLASAAVVCMGEGNEQKPLALITNAPVKFVSKINKKELYINLKEDIYKPFFKNIKK